MTRRTPGRTHAVSRLAALVLIGLAGCAAAHTSNAAELPKRQAISQYGITWTFDKPVPAGRFVTGDWYVVGPVTVVSVDPAPTGKGKAFRNGSMLNPPVTTESAYDGRMRGCVPEKLGAKFPLKMSPGDSLVSSASLDAVQANQTLDNPTRKTETSPIRTQAVLTCLAEAVPADTFRPGYCDRQKRRLHSASEIHWDRLPGIKPIDGYPDWATVERWFQRPWIDHVYGWTSREVHASENMPGYGREVGRAVSYAALMLSMDVRRERKATLLNELIQVGIDNWAIAVQGKKGVCGGWPAAGGFGNGRKLPIVFAAVVLDDKDMLRVGQLGPDTSFGEDEHTEFGKCWTGATVRFAGQYPLIGDKQPDRGPYEHLTPDKWPGNKPTMSEGYRRCCTSICWVGQALTMRLMGAQKVWNHDAFFVYVDRWMTEDDSEFVKKIHAAHPDFSEKTMRQGSTGMDPWIDKMWARYRPTLQPPPDGWRPKH